MTNLEETIRLHAMWLKKEEGGIRADLIDALTITLRSWL